MSRRLSKFSIHNFSYKILITIVILLIASIIFLIKIGKPVPKISAAWFNDAWSYRKAISITNPNSSNLTDYQVRLSLDTQTLISGSKMQSDCDDLRITNSDSVSLLNYWIESGCNTNNTIIWVKVPNLAGNTTQILYYYYGNTTASTYSSGDNTFDAFDDFNGDTLDANKWIDYNPQSLGTISISGGTLAINMSPAGGALTAHSRGIMSKEKFNFSNHVIETNSRWNINTMPLVYDSAAKQVMISDIQTPTSLCSYSYSGEGNQYLFMYRRYVGLFWVNLHEYIFNKCVNGSNTEVVKYTLNNDAPSSLEQEKYSWYGTSGGTQSSGRSTNGGSSFSTLWGNQTQSVFNLPSQSYWGFSGTNRSLVSHLIILDWIRIRKYAATEPTSTQQGIEEQSPAPIAYWKFDEGIGATAHDSTPNKIDGTFGTGSSAPAWQTENQCVSGKCLYFDGGDYINSNKDFSWSTSDSFSIGFWIKPNSVTGSQGIIGKGEAGGYGTGNWEWSVKLTNNTLNFTYWNASGNTEIGLNSSVTLNKWDYFYITYDPTNYARLYKNGELVSTDTSVTNALQDRSTPILIGHAYYTSGTNFYFNGFLDDIKIYNYSRNAAQILSDFNSRGTSKGSSANLGTDSTTPSLSSKLIAHWKFDEGSGTTTNNSSSAGPTFNGTFNNSPIWSTDSKFGKSIQFSSSGSPQYISIPGTNTLENLTENDFTFSLWMKPGTSSYNQYAISRPGYHTGIFYSTDQHIYFNVWNSSNSYFAAASINTYSPNTWHHVAGTVDSQNKVIKLYIDGKYDSSNTYTSSLRDYGTTQYLIGSGYFSGLCTESSRYCFNGQIDEVKIYNYALTSDEIRLDYNQGSAINFGSNNQTIGGTTASLDYCIPGDTSPCSSPIAAWNMEEHAGTTIKDISGNNNNGTLGAGNSAPTWKTGKIGSSLNFDGINDHVNLGTPSLMGSDGVTFSAWIKPTVSKSYNFIVGKGNMSSDNPSLKVLGLGMQNGNLSLYISQGNNTGWCKQANQVPISYNTWSYVVGTYYKTTQTIKLYVNGIQKYQTTCNQTGDSEGSETLFIGDDSTIWWPDGFFGGQIDDVRIYNYARTPAQIAYDYNKGAPVGWWKFDECQGNISNDSSGIGNTGSISIGSSGVQNSLGTCQIGTSAAWTNGANGKYNSSLNFDGTDDIVNLGNPSTYNFGTGSFSYGLWVYVPSSAGPYDMPIWKGGASAANAGYDMELGSSDWGAGVGDGTRNFYSSFGSETLNQWVHLIAVIDRQTNQFRTYKNGKLVQTVDISTLGSTDSSNSLTMSSSSYPFKGKLDDVRIYNYALTPTQIKTLYNNGAASFSN